MAKKLVYSFGGGKADGHGGLKNLLGGKGANLAEMARLGLPVPPGFTITTDVCSEYYSNNRHNPPGLRAQVEKALAKMEKEAGARFGDSGDPLLVSCRSGARVSMPGMMDTVLNIGLNDTTIQGLIAKTGNPRFAYDSYRRFVNMYGDVVMGVKAETEHDEDPFDLVMSKVKKDKGVTLDTELDADDLKGLVRLYKELIRKRLHKDFPEDPIDQLWGAISAVFNSWMIPRAVAYRQLNHYPEDWGTAVNVQAMVFGNMGENSATGVAFTRDPSTGDDYFYGEYLINAQGEDVVAGIRTPVPINSRSGQVPPGGGSTLEDGMPGLYGELAGIREILEKHYRDMQDIEFTIQEGKLWMLQCRNGKRTGTAALRIAVDLVREKLITPQEAVMRLQPDLLTQVLLPSFDIQDPAHKSRRVIGKGLAASPGAAVGTVVFSASAAEDLAKKTGPDGAPNRVILVRIETSPEDIKGMYAAQGILTARGGMTSHAAVVARGMGRPCVAGSSDITVDYEGGFFTAANGDTIRAGDWISLDGSRGEIIKGKLPTRAVELTGEFAEFMGFVDKFKKINVRTNSDTPRDSQIARDYGAEGIGLCRTEHMFFEADRIDHVRRMILSDDLAGRKECLAKLLPMQRGDFYGIFKAMDGLPVTIRTLDPPLHEFLPHADHEIEDLASRLKLPAAKVKTRIAGLREQNPMLGLRGCRLGILFPEITEMQVKAIIEAAAQALGEGIDVQPEIMIPLVGHEKEFALQKEIVDRVAAEVQEQTGQQVKYLVGTMIELPRAALEADRIVKAGAQFFSFGTNDLTQTTYGLSRDDSGSFLNRYSELHIWTEDPFVSLDQDGVGQLVDIGVQKGRSADRKLKVGICGEHGGDPSSVRFCCSRGFNYVSCSPPRVPVALLAAAQYAIEESGAAAPRKPAARRAASARKPAAKRAASARKPAAKRTASARKPAARRASTARKPAARTASSARKPAARKPASSARKPAARRTSSARKPASSARKPAARKPASSARKPAARRPASSARKPAARKPASSARKPAPRKPAARKPAPRKPAARKPAPRRTAK